MRLLRAFVDALSACRAPSATQPIADRVTSERDPHFGGANNLGARVVVLSVFPAVWVGLLRPGPPVLERLR